MAGGVAPHGPLLRAVLPRPFDKAAFDARIRAGAEEFKESLKYSFDDTTNGWSGAKPTFQPRVYIKPTEIKITVALTGDAEGVAKWKYLNFGTKPHVIVPRNAKILRFQTGSVPKTIVRNVMTGRGKAASGPYIYAKQVMHPGIQAREWDKVIAEKKQPDFQQTMERYVRWAVRDSGHPYP